MRFLRPWIKTMAASDVLTVPVDQKWKLKLCHVADTAKGHLRYQPYDVNTYQILAANGKVAYWNGSAEVLAYSQTVTVLDLWLRPNDQIIASGEACKVLIEIYADD